MYLNKKKKIKMHCDYETKIKLKKRLMNLKTVI